MDENHRWMDKHLRNLDKVSCDVNADQWSSSRKKGMEDLQSVSWSLAEFRHNKIVQSPHENYFNVCQQHKEK